MINFDLLVAGCNTRCRHCYVNGGPMPLMDGDHALRCIEQLDRIASFLPGDTNFTLDHEPMNHPEIERIMQAAVQTEHIRYYHHGMTTGVALMRRADKETVLDRYLSLGYDCFGITIHGNEALHDEITRRTGAYGASIAFGEFVKSQGAELEVSLMINRYFPEQTAELSEMLDRLRPDYVYVALVNFTPHVNMMDYEGYRASVETVNALGDWLNVIGKDGAETIARAEQNNAASVARMLENMPDLKRLFLEPQDEKYLCIHPDCKLYIGNSGAETQCLGDLLSIDPKKTADTICAAPDNRDYGAFYDPEKLPPIGKLIAALRRLPQRIVYSDVPSVIYRGLAELGTPTKILQLRSDQQ